MTEENSIIFEVNFTKMRKNVFCLCLLMSLSVFGLSAQTVDEIIAKHLQAMGGKDKLTSIQSVVMQGVVNAQGMEIPVKTTILHKKGMRIDFSMMGMDAWTIMRPDSGWSFMPFGGQTKPEPIPVDMLEQSAEQWDLSGQLCDYSNKGNQLDYLGMDDVDGTECHKLKCTSAKGKVTYYLIDPSSFYLVKTVSKINAGGKEMDAESKFSNYKEVGGGYVFPHTIESQNGPIEMTKISVNDAIDASILMVKQ